MKHKNLFNQSLILFFIIILAVPVYWVARGKIEPQRSLMEYRTLNVFPNIDFVDIKSSVYWLLKGKTKEATEAFLSQILDQELQSSTELAVSDQLPFRSAGIQLAKNLNRLSIRAAYLFTFDKVIPADNKSTVFEIPEKGTLIPAPLEFGRENKKSIDAKISNYETILKLHQNINIHVFYIDSISNSAQNPIKYPGKKTDNGLSYYYFMENKPDGLPVESLMLTSLDDHNKYFYRTDHHWNVYGLLSGYKKIYNMLAKNYLEISPMQDLEEIYTFPDIEFHGSWSRAVYYKVRPGDSFDVILSKLPPYKILDINGEEIDYNQKDEYLSGVYSRSPFADHYIEYYGKDVDFLEYVFENSAARNLLIIGDSYTNSIEPLLASHYHHTYAVDIRYWPDYYFSLTDFLAKYDVDDILVLGGPTAVMYSSRWSINP